MGLVGVNARQLFGSIAIVAVLGAGTALADTSTAVNSTSSESTSEITQSSSLSVHTDSTSSAVSSGSAVSLPLDHTAAPLVIEEVDAASTQVPTDSQLAAPSSSGHGNYISTNTAVLAGEGAKQVSVAATVAGTSGMPYYYRINQSAVIGAEAGQAPLQPVVKEYPGQPASTPFGGMLGDFGFLSESVIPSSTNLLSLAAGLSFALTAILWLVFSLFVIRSKSQPAYMEFLRNTGFSNAPRSDAMSAFSSATPLKWVLSGAFIRA